MTNSRSKPSCPPNTSYLASGIELPLVTAVKIAAEHLAQMPDEAKIALLEEIIEDDFGGNAAAFSRHKGVNRGLVSRAINHGYIAPAVSRAMGWPIRVEVPACPHCGDTAHTYDCQTEQVKPKQERPKRKRKPRTGRATINTKSAESAARTLLNKTSSVYRQELIRILSEEQVK